MPSHPVDVHVGSRLRLRRRMLRISQESIGKAIGVTFQQIQKYEKGVNRVGSSRLYAFAKILSVPIAFFFEDFSENTQEGFAESPAAFDHGRMDSKETANLVSYYYQISDPTVRRKVMGIIKSLAASTGEDE